MQLAIFCDLMDACRSFAIHFFTKKNSQCTVRNVWAGSSETQEYQKVNFRFHKKQAISSVAE
jgi:hypothetical protein